MVVRVNDPVGQTPAEPGRVTEWCDRAGFVDGERGSDAVAAAIPPIGKLPSPFIEVFEPLQHVRPPVNPHLRRDTRLIVVPAGIAGIVNAPTCRSTRLLAKVARDESLYNLADGIVFDAERFIVIDVEAR